MSERQQILVPGTHVADTVTCVPENPLRCSSSCATLALLQTDSEPDHLHRRAADYVSRILKGDKAGDLPVQMPIKFNLVINLKTAKALDITVATSLLATADEVIE